MLETIAWISLTVAFFCALLIAADVARRRQPMWIMNIVWPVTALYWSVAGLLFYMGAGRAQQSSGQPKSLQHRHSMQQQRGDQMQPGRISLKQVAIATSHCGAGCALADVVVEFAIFRMGLVFLGNELWASYLWDFVGAWLLGILFQYFSIQPMRHLSPLAGLGVAIKADTLSILAFQVGMYLWMAAVHFVIFPKPRLHPNQASYWLMMQIGMICGFLTSLPMNRLLIRIGWKEAMG